MSHLIFFDGDCALCHRAVRFLWRADRRKKLLFAPLQGKTAEKLLTPPVPLDSLVLVEHYNTPRQKELRYGKAALRIYWLLGGWWRIIGLLSFLPAFLADPVYRLIAKKRHLFQGGKFLRDTDLQQDQFLP